MFNSWEVLDIPSGTPGTEATLQKMRELVAADQLEAIVRETALTLLNRWRPESTAAGVDYFRRWVRRHVALINEPIEMLHRPAWMLRAIQEGPPWPWGDCDDVTMLAAALYLAVGLPTRLTAVRPAGGTDFVHVFPEVFFENAWFVADPVSDRIPPADWDTLEMEL